MQTRSLPCDWPDVGPPGSRATSFHTCQVRHAGSSRRSRLRARLYSLPPSQRRQHPEYESLRGSMAGLCAPLPTLRCHLHRRPRTARGRCGSLLLHRIGLAPTTHCRSPGALRKILDTTNAIDVIGILSDLFILHGIPAHIRSDNGSEFVAKAVRRTVTSRASTRAFATSCSTAKSSTRSERPESSSRAGGSTNTIRPHASLGYKPPAPEVFVPAFAAWPAALRR